MNVSSLLPRTCDRTTLRQLSHSDLARFQAYRTDPQVARYQSWEKMTDEEAMAFIHSTRSQQILVPGTWSQIGIAYSDNDFLIGDVGIRIDQVQEEAEIGFTIARDYQNRGIGKETVREAIKLIFEHTRVKRIIGITDERNLASLKLLKALGMIKISTDDVLFRGEPCSELTFALFRKSDQCLGDA